MLNVEVVKVACAIPKQVMHPPDICTLECPNDGPYEISNPRIVAELEELKWTGCGTL